MQYESRFKSLADVQAKQAQDASRVLDDKNHRISLLERQLKDIAYGIQPVKIGVKYSDIISLHVYHLSS